MNEYTTRANNDFLKLIDKLKNASNSVSCLTNQYDGVTDHYYNSVHLYDIKVHSYSY